MKKQIPNMLSTLRIVLIPLFVHLFFLPECRAYAIGVFAFIGATDVLDGYLARKYNWITPLGKILDPVADKITQGVVLICLTIENDSNIFFVILTALFFLKETAMIVGSLVIIRRKNIVAPSLSFGKLASFAFFCMAIIIMLQINTTLNIVLAAVLILTTLSVLALYYFKAFRNTYGFSLRKKRKE